MKLQIKPLISDILISAYIVITLFFRIKLEQNHTISPLNSMVFGGSFVVIIWVLIKLKILNPNWFGLFNSKKTTK